MSDTKAKTQLELFGKPLDFWVKIAYKSFGGMLIYVYFLLRNILGYPELIIQIATSRLFDIIFTKIILMTLLLLWMGIGIIVNHKYGFFNFNKHPMFEHRMEAIKTLKYILPIEVIINSFYLFE